MISMSLFGHAAFAAGKTVNALQSVDESGILISTACFRIVCERQQVSRAVLGGEPVHLKSRYHARLLWPERTEASSPAYADEVASSRVDAPSFTPSR